MECESNPCSEKSFPSGKKENGVFFVFKEIRNRKFGKKILLMTLDMMGFELRNPFQHLFLLDIPKLGIQN